MDPDKSPESPEKRSRVRDALQVLRGEPVVPRAIRAEWLAWQIEFENVLDKISAAAARAYERDRVKLKAANARIKELEAAAPKEDVGTGAPYTGYAGSWNPAKRQLNRLALSRRGLPVPSFSNGETPNVPGPEAE